MSKHFLSVRRVVALGFVAALAAPAGCRSITDASCPADAITANIITSNSLSVNATTASAATVSRPGGTLPARVQVQTITIQQADVQFAGTGSGTVDLAVAINGYLATLGTLTITDGSVSELSPSTLPVGQYSPQEAQAIVEALPEAERAGLNLQDVTNLSPAQIRDAVSAAVRDTSFEVVVLTHATGNLFGAVTIERFTFQLGC